MHQGSIVAGPSDANCGICSSRSNVANQVNDKNLTRVMFLVMDIEIVALDLGWVSYFASLAANTTTAHALGLR